MGQFLPARGCEFLLVSLGEGFGVGFRWVAGGGFPVENEGKGEGGGGGGGRERGGVGTCKGAGKPMCMRLSKLPFSKPPFSFSDWTHLLALGCLQTGCHRRV